MRDALKAEYSGILNAYLAGEGEAAVLRAYEFARNCMRDGLAPDDVVGFHIELVEHIRDIPHDSQPTDLQHTEDAKSRAQNLLLEVIMAFSLCYRLTLEELEHSNRELERVVRFKSRMLSMVAHDLTNHITATKIYANGIAQREQGSETGRHAENILEVVGEQEVLIRNLLDIAAIDSGRLQLTIEPQPLMKLIQRSVSRVSKTTSKHTFSTGGPDVQVLADRAKLQQILDNLIGNAVKYSPQGSAIDVVVDVRGEQAAVEIRDRGVGVAAEDLPHLFEPFYRGAVASQSTIPGTGLGLSIVRSLVMLQGGSISINSAVGEGTTLRFSLPLAPNETARAGETDPLVLANRRE